MRPLIYLLILSMLSPVSWASSAQEMDPAVLKKLEVDYGPIAAVCSDEAQELLGEFVELEDPRCDNKDFRFCLYTSQYPIGIYKMHFMNATCEVRVMGTSIKKYQNTIICEDLQGRSICGGQYDWAKPKKSIIPPFILRLIN